MTIIFKKVKSITHEITGLSEIVAHNFRQLGIQYRLQGRRQFKYLGINQSKWIGSILIPLDVMMRKESFMLKDCLPNVPDNGILF
jgi:hypothetical protein